MEDLPNDFPAPEFNFEMQTIKPEFQFAPYAERQCEKYLPSGGKMRENLFGAARIIRTAMVHEACET
jgi:hypothetical protein